MSILVSFLILGLSILYPMSILSNKRRELQESAAAGIMLTKIDLSNCALEELPVDLLLPFKDTLEFVNLGGNHLSSLPEELVQCQRLRILFFAGNRFTSIPTLLGRLPNLYMLSFKGNQVQRVPDEALSPSIQWLILTDNQIEGKDSRFNRQHQYVHCS